MKYVACLAWLLVVANGCAPESQVSKEHSDPDSPIKQNVRESRSVDLTENRNLTTPDHQLAATLKEFSQQARELEAELRFEEALASREKIVELTELRFGRDSWQVKNAQIGMEFARQAVGFGDQKKQQFLTARKFNQTAAELLAEQDYEPALQNALDSLNLLYGLTGPESVGVGRQVLQIAEIREKLGLHEEAASDIHRGIRILRGRGYDCHPLLEMAHSTLAAIYARADQFPPSIANQKVATRMASQLWGEQSVQYAMQANQLGTIYHQSGENETALKVLRGSEAIYRLNLGPDALDVGSVRMNIGRTLMNIRNFSEALDNFQMAEQVFIKLIPRPHSFIVECKTKMATIHLMEHRYVLAEDLLHSAVEEQQQVTGVTPAQLAATEYQLSIALGQQGKYDRTQPLLEKIIEIQQRDLGVANPFTVRSLQAYAIVLKETQQVEAAQRVYHQIEQVTALNADGNRLRR